MFGEMTAPPTRPTISAVVAAYQAEDWIGEALDSILGQTHAPDEVVVVDDGSTDGTAAVLAGYGDRIRVVRQANGGCPAAFNTAFRHATSDFVALCGADDIWEPRKLEWQLATIVAHPEVDFLFGHAEMFGRIEEDHLRPAGRGLLDGRAFAEELFGANAVCAPSMVIRRARFEALGPFWEDFGADDYEYWFRGLRAGAAFFYDERTLLRYRQHDSNLSAKRLWMDECLCRVRLEYERDLADRAVVDAVLARELFKLGRQLADAGRAGEARQAFRGALRHGRRGASHAANARAAVWVGLLSLPAAVRARVERAAVAATRAVDAATGGREAGLP